MEYIRKEKQLRARWVQMKTKAATIDISCFADSDSADSDMSYKKMQDLIGSTGGQLDKARDCLRGENVDNNQFLPEMEGDMSEEEMNRLQEINTTLLWKAHIDIENIEDIHVRLSRQSFQQRICKIKAAYYSYLQLM